MPFWTLDKKSNTPGIFGSIAVMSKHIAIPANTLYNYFSRENKQEFEYLPLSVTLVTGSSLKIL